VVAAIAVRMKINHLGTTLQKMQCKRNHNGSLSEVTFMPALALRKPLGRGITNIDEKAHQRMYTTLQTAATNLSLHDEAKTAARSEKRAPAEQADAEAGEQNRWAAIQPVELHPLKK